MTTASCTRPPRQPVARLGSSLTSGVAIAAAPWPWAIYFCAETRRRLRRYTGSDDPEERRVRVYAAILAMRAVDVAQHRYCNRRLFEDLEAAHADACAGRDLPAELFYRYCFALLVLDEAVPSSSAGASSSV
jgi:hypothetical protein